MKYLVSALVLFAVGCGLEKNPEHLNTVYVTVESPTPSPSPSPSVEIADAHYEPCEILNTHTIRCVFYNQVTWVFKLSDGKVCTCQEGRCRRCEDKKESHKHHCY